MLLLLLPCCCYGPATRVAVCWSGTSHLPNHQAYIPAHLGFLCCCADGSKGLLLLLLLLGVLLLLLLLAAGCHTTSSSVPSGAVQVVWMTPAALVEQLAASDAREHTRTPLSKPLPAPAAARLCHCRCLHSEALTAATRLHSLPRPILLLGTAAAGRCTCGVQRGRLRIRVGLRGPQDSAGSALTATWGAYATVAVRPAPCATGCTATTRAAGAKPGAAAASLLQGSIPGPSST
jgi:hypothetical protein